MHITLISFLLDSGVTFVPQARYASFLRREWRLARQGSRAIGVADWYVEPSSGGPPKVVNETYSVLQLDADGSVDWQRWRIGGARNRAELRAV